MAARARPCAGAAALRQDGTEAAWVAIKPDSSWA